MSRRWFFTLALLLGAVLLPGVLSAAESEEFVVQKMVPQGEIKGLAQVSLMFSSPVVSSETVGKILAYDQGPALFEPELEGTWKWTDAQTCLFIPSSPPIPATRYRVMLSGNLRDRKGRLLAGTHDFVFSTPRLQLEAAVQRDFRQNRYVDVELRFNLPVAPQRLRGYLDIRDYAGKRLSWNLKGEHPSRRIFLSVRVDKKEEITITLFQGLPPVMGTLGLAQDRAVVLEPKFTLEISNSRAASSYNRKGSIWIETTSPVDVSQAAPFVDVEPEQPFSLEPGRGGFWINGNFAPRDRVVVTVKKGLPGLKECRLARRFRKAFVIPDMDADLDFAAGGDYLSARGSLRVPLAGVNVDKIRLTAWKMYDNNIPLALGLDYSWLSKELSRKNESAVYDTHALKNEPFRFAVDLKELLSPDHGVYLLQASDVAGNVWRDSRLMVTLTDLGITAKVFPKGIFVWTNSLLDASPVPEATVRIYSRSNQLLGTLTTDERGIALLEREKPWEDDLQPWVITVEKKEDLSYLVLRYDLLRGDDWELGGRPYLDEGYEAYLFTPRGIYRPGETAHLQGIVRNKDFAAPGTFPLEWLVFEPGGRKIYSETAMLTSRGFVSLSLPLSDASPTGEYRAVLRIPGENGTVVGRHTFLVEDFVPPRIKVTAGTETKKLAPEEDVTLHLKGDYLFGAPGANLGTEGEVHFIPQPFRPKGYGGYVFEDPEVKMSPYSDFLGSGTLDAEGKGTFTWTAPPRETLPKPGKLAFRLGVMEEGGRWVWDALSVPYHPTPLYVGIQDPQGQEMRPGREISFPVVALNTDGSEAADVPWLNLQFFRVIYHSMMVEEDGRYRFRYERELLPFPVKAVTLNEGKGTARFVPEQYGSYMVRVKDPEGRTQAASSFYIWGSEGASSGAPLDRVTLRMDKQAYALGETATLRCNLPFKGNLLLTVETDRVVHWQYFKDVENLLDVKIPVQEAMLPNAYCVAWLLRPEGKDNANWYNPRALGVTRFSVDQSEKKARVSLELPDRVRPLEEFTVRACLQDALGNPLQGDVLLALVDEGILSLTNYATPNPYGFFTAMRSLGTRGYDLYNDLLPPEEQATSLLHPAGGEGRNALFGKGLSPVRARRFKPVALVKGPFATDEKGILEETFSVPEFSGTLRAMAVAAGTSLVGARAEELLVARDVVVESTLPRALAPGDSFSMPLTLFSKSEEYLGVEISIEAEGPLVYEGMPSFQLMLAPGKTSERMDIPLKVKEGASGVGILRLRASWNDKSMEQKTELPVRPPYPLIRRSGGGLVKGGTQKILDFGTAWFPGTLQGVLALSGTPVARLSTAFQYLETYPYGCLEQTTSGAWPLVALPELVRDLDPLMVDPEENRSRVDRAIGRVVAMQLYDGSFSFWPGGGSTFLWGSVYASHFLLEASRKGYDVPGEALQGALQWLERLLPEETGAVDEEYRNRQATKAYSMYVLALAGKPPLAWMEHFREEADSLGSTAKLFLGGAYALTGQSKTASALLGKTAVSISSSGEGIFASGVRDTAVALLMRVHLNPKSEQAALLAQKLLEASEKGLWRNTQENAFASVALGRYFQSTRSLRKPFTAVLRETPESEPLVTLAQGERKALSLDASSGAPELSCAGEGSVFYSWSVEGVPQEAPAPYAKGLEVTRNYFRREQEVPLEPGEKVRQGELLEVELTLRSDRSVEHVVLSDLLPGGLEIDNPRLQAALEGTDRYVSVREEIRDDRLLLFVPYLREKKTFTYVYRVRAVTSGTFTVPPVAAEAMYDPGIQALGTSGTLTIIRGESQ